MGAKHVGFLTVVNNIIVCSDKAYSAVSVWDKSKTVRWRGEAHGRVLFGQSRVMVGWFKRTRLSSNMVAIASDCV